MAIFTIISVRVIIFPVICLSLLIFSPGFSHSADDPMTLEIYPYAPAADVLKQFGPLANYLKRTLKREVNLKISKDNNELRERVASDKADLAFVGPSMYIKIVESSGQKHPIARIATKGRPLLQGVVITATSSSLTSLKDLKGKRFAFGYENSTMSHLVPVSMLQEEGIDLDDLAGYDFLSDQYNVALGVLMGDYDAGAVNADVFHKYKERGLKVLAWTPEISEHLFLGRSTLSESSVSALKKAFLEVMKDSEARNILSSLREGVSGFAPVSDSDYDNLRALLRKIRTGKTDP